MLIFCDQVPIAESADFEVPSAYPKSYPDKFVQSGSYISYNFLLLKGFFYLVYCELFSSLLSGKELSECHLFCDFYLISRKHSFDRGGLHAYGFQQIYFF